MPLSDHVPVRTAMVIPKDIAVPKEACETPRKTRSDLDLYRYASKGGGVIIGPMPVKAFLDEFLPSIPDGKPMPRPGGAFSRSLQNLENEKVLSDSLVRVLIF